ncbi:MAG: GFA family protein [Pseudomonadota bacterium]
MPSDILTARCYCGAYSLEFHGPAETIAYCHCSDCKRWTGSPLPAFAAYPTHAIVGALPEPVSFAKGVLRRHCADCGSPLTAEFDYLPGQVYVPLGLFDDASALQPQIHAHADAALPWLHLEDGLPRQSGSARETLRGDP